MNDGARSGLIALLGLLVALWTLAAALALSLIEGFDYGERFNVGWRVLLLLATAASPWVVLASSGWREVGFAYGVFFIAAVVFFGACVVGA